MLMPRPLPEAPFVVKNGSKMRCFTSSDIPVPVSSTLHHTSLARRSVRSVSRPPAGMAAVALTAMEIADGGEAYPPGVRDLARRTAEDCRARALTLGMLSKRAG